MTCADKESVGSVNISYQIRQPWVHLLALPLVGCVALEKLFNLSEPQV